MPITVTTTELFLVAMAIIFSVPYLVWRLGRTDYWAPLVVVQILTGIVFGPGLLGRVFPEVYATVFNPAVVQSLNGVAWWAVMLFVWIAGVELDLKQAWKYRRESAITAGLALGAPVLVGCAAGLLLASTPGWMGPAAAPWQFVLGVGMSCAVTALPILILLLEKLDILRQPLGQRILRYASLDDVAIWGVLALILMDWQRVGRQALFLAAFALAAAAVRWLMQRIPERDRWYIGLIWLAVVAFGADWSGLHYMVGAFLAGAVLDAEWFPQDQMDSLRAALLLVASVAGKLAGVHLAGRVLGWKKGDASIIGWLLQTKALIMIIFANILLDKRVITSETFTALLLMAVASTMLTVPMVAPKLRRLKALITTQPEASSPPAPSAPHSAASSSAAQTGALR